MKKAGKNKANIESTNKGEIAPVESPVEKSNKVNCRECKNLKRAGNDLCAKAGKNGRAYGYASEKNKRGDCKDFETI